MKNSVWSAKKQLFLRKIFYYFIIWVAFASQIRALRTSPTNRGSSLRFASGLPQAGAPITATSLNQKANHKNSKILLTVLIHRL